MMNTAFHWALEMDGRKKNLCMISFHGFNVKIGLKLQCAVTTCYAPMPF